MNDPIATSDGAARRDSQGSRRSPTRACIFWCGGSSYISAGIRHLQRDPRLDVSFRVQLDARGYDSSIFDGIDDVLTISADRIDDVESQIEAVVAARPEVLVVSGWMLTAYLRLATDPRLRDTRFVMCIDRAWQGTMRQHITSLVRRRYLRRMSLVVAAGERSRVFARHMGVPEPRIRLGSYCCDFDAFAVAAESRRALPSWPRRLLFVGRLVEAKGLDTLVDGYARYRALVQDPWPLSICGRGPLEHLVEGQEGIELLGFVQPVDLPRIFAEHGALLLPSRHEPWGVAIAEACAAGLPVACSERCGAGVDLVRDYSNGITFASGDARGIRDALLYFHRHEERLEEMGRISSTLAMPYSARHWAMRWAEYLLAAASPDGDP